MLFLPSWLTICTYNFTRVQDVKEKYEKTTEKSPKYSSNYLDISQSLDVEQSSAYCFANAMGARQTLAPLVAETSHTRPDSQSASRRHNSPSFRP